MVIIVTIMAIIGLILISVCMVNSARIEELNFRIDDLMKRVDNVAEAGKILNMKIGELDSHSRMGKRLDATRRPIESAKGVEAERVEEAKKRARL